MDNLRFFSSYPQDGEKMIVLKKKTLIIISALCLTVIAFIVCVSGLRMGSALSSEQPKTKIVLDAGHGGVDSGVTGIKSGVKESDLNLVIVKKLEKYLIDAGFEVVLTRSTNAGLYGVATKGLKKKDMQKRKEIICKTQPSLVISVHLNKFGIQSRRGAQIFYKEGNENSKILAESIQSSFNNLEESTRNFSPLSGDYYILNCSEYTSVIAECGFLSNPEEEAMLLTDEYQNKVAYSIFKGIVSYLSQTSLNPENG